MNIVVSLKNGCTIVLEDVNSYIQEDQHIKVYSHCTVVCDLVVDDIQRVVVCRI